MTTKPLDLLSLIADDKSIVAYRPRWNTFTGGMSQTVLLQQVIYWWIKSGRRPFYKFARPCGHRLYRPGDSWEEELSIQRREFENARRDVAARTHGDINDASLVSYWVDAQRVTWYALNEPLLLDHLAHLYPPAAAVGVQLPIPQPELMDETYIRSDVPNVHQPPADLMDETYISSNGRNVHQLMDETYISTDVPNVHPLITKNKTTSQRSPQTTTAIAPPPPAAVAAADPLAPLLDWIGFDDALTDKERQTLDPTTLLAWAYWVKLKQAESGSRVHNPVGLVRAQWRAGRQPRADLLSLARGWFRLDDDGRARLLGRLEWIGEFTAHDPAVPLDDEFPNLPLATAAAVHAATGGHLAPPALSPAAPIAPPAPPEPDPPLPAPTAPPAAGQSPIWKTALGDLQYQLDHGPFNAWLRGTTAAETADGLTVYVASDHALDWLRGRLHPLIERVVASVADRPLPVRYEVRP